MPRKMITTNRSEEVPNKCYYHSDNAEVAPTAIGYVPGLWHKFGVCKEHAETTDGKYAFGRPVLYENGEQNG